MVRSRAAAASRNLAEPGAPPPTWIAIQDGRVLGFVTTIPVRFWDGETSLPAYWIKGLMVLPEYRQGPIGYAVLKAAVAALPRTGSLAVAAPARRLFTALGYTDLGAVSNWIRPLAAHRILANLTRNGSESRACRAGLVRQFGWLGPPAWRPQGLGWRARASNRRGGHAVAGSRLDCRSGRSA